MDFNNVFNSIYTNIYKECLRKYYSKIYNEYFQNINKDEYEIFIHKTIEKIINSKKKDIKIEYIQLKKKIITNNKKYNTYKTPTKLYELMREKNKEELLKLIKKYPETYKNKKRIKVWGVVEEIIMKNNGKMLLNNNTYLDRDKKEHVCKEGWQIYYLEKKISGKTYNNTGIALKHNKLINS